MRSTLLSFLLLSSLAGSAFAAGFQVHSSDIQNNRLSNTQVFNGFGCNGDNISPHLSWSGAPAGTKSFVVTVYDPDAPTGSGWWHWIVANIPANTNELPTGAGNDASKLPAGVLQARNDYGQHSFGGACPPPGKPHRYQITVTALKVEKLELAPDASAALIGYMTNANSLGKATLTATYGR